MPRADTFLCRIGYAEEWLRRARRDWRKGDTPAAVRRLMLAEAEIRHAREIDAARDVRPAWPSSSVTGWRLTAGLAAAAMVAAGIGYASVWTAPPSAAVAARGGAAPLNGGAIGAPIVQLDTGRFLLLDPGQESAGTAAGPGVAAPAPPADGALGGPGVVGAGPRPDAGPAPLPARVTGVPVDLRTSSPTF